MQRLLIANKEAYEKLVQESEADKKQHLIEKEELQQLQRQMQI